MHTFTELFQSLANPEWIMQHGGLYIVLLIVFAETGLFVGFFLPGDSLLFIAGMILANTLPEGAAAIPALTYWILLISLAGIVGNYVGYWFGRSFSIVLMEKKDTFLFKKKYLLQAKEFYEQKGGKAIVLARFLPIVRTFAPIVAGMVRMNVRRFSFYNIAGSFAWVGSIVMAGFLLGEHVWIKANLEKVILIIVVLTTAPVILKMLQARRKSAIQE